METLKITQDQYLHLQMFSRMDNRKEVCALIYATEKEYSYCIERIIQVRNTKRTEGAFGISKSDFREHICEKLIGLYHSHELTLTLSEKDKQIFIRHEFLKFQLIGLINKATNKLNLICYSNSFNILKITNYETIYFHNFDQGENETSGLRSRSESGKEF